jgi:hypothetical protein
MTDREFYKIMRHVNAIQEFVNQGGHCIYDSRLIVRELWMDLLSPPHDISLRILNETMQLVTPTTTYPEAYLRLTKLFEIYDEPRPTSELFQPR